MEILLICILTHSILTLFSGVIESNCRVLFPSNIFKEFVTIYCTRVYPIIFKSMVEIAAVYKKN